MCYNKDIIINLINMAKKNTAIKAENKSIQAENKAVKMENENKGVLIRFIQSYTNQAKGDTTKVSEEKAKRLVEAGFAEIIK